VLQGAVGESARADVLAYAAPTYYGMLVAQVTQTAA
jgi:aromatic ring-opening dioxygenase LigB subunit